MMSVIRESGGRNILEDARTVARGEQLGYAGRVTPPEAWALVSAGEAVLVDVRSAEELKFVGRVPRALHVAWASGIALARNPRFLPELERAVAKDRAVLFLCRSGVRSERAAEAATAAGFRLAFNVREGFEGDKDERSQRGRRGGWRHHGLPWTQD